MLVGVVVFGVSFAIFFVSGSLQTGIGVLVLAAIAMGFVGLVVSLATVLVFQSGMKVGEALKAAAGKIFSYLWLVALVGVVSLGGFVLFVIPGVIFTVWFAFSIYIFVAEGKKGMEAMMASKEYVRGYWWPILGRLAVLVLVGFLFYLVLSIPGIILGSNLGQLMNAVADVVFTPFIFIYAYLIYKNLKSLKPEVATSPTPRENRGWFAAAGVLGVVATVVPLIILLFLYPVISTISSDIQYEDFDLENFDPEAFSDIDPSLLEGLNIPQ